VVGGKATDLKEGLDVATKALDSARPPDDWIGSSRFRTRNAHDPKSGNRFSDKIMRKKDRIVSDILAKIETYKREEIARPKHAPPLGAGRGGGEGAPAPRGFCALERRIKRGDYALIAEIKKASPSKGLIRKTSIRPRSRWPLRPAAPHVFRC